MKKVARGLLVAVLLTGVPLIGSLSTEAAPVAAQKAVDQKSIKESIRLAKLGRVINSGQFGIGSKKEAIIKKWGKAESSADNVLQYKKRGVSFSFTQNKVVKVGTKDKRVLSLTPAEAKKLLGTPIEQDQGAGQVYQTYKAGKFFIELHWTNVTDNGKLKLVEWSVIKK